MIHFIKWSMSFFHRPPERTSMHKKSRLISSPLLLESAHSSANKNESWLLAEVGDLLLMCLRCEKSTSIHSDYATTTSAGSRAFTPLWERFGRQSWYVFRMFTTIQHGEEIHTWAFIWVVVRLGGGKPYFSCLAPRVLELCRKTRLDNVPENWDCWWYLATRFARSKQLLSC